MQSLIDAEPGAHALCCLLALCSGGVQAGLCGVVAHCRRSCKAFLSASWCLHITLCGKVFKPSMQHRASGLTRLELQHPAVAAWAPPPIAEHPNLSDAHGCGAAVQDHAVPDSHMYVELFRCCAASPGPQLLELATAARLRLRRQWSKLRSGRVDPATEECVPWLGSSTCTSGAVALPPWGGQLKHTFGNQASVRHPIVHERPASV